MIVAAKVIYEILSDICSPTDPYMNMFCLELVCLSTS